ADPEVAARLATELAFNAGVLLESLDDDLLVEGALELLRRDQARRSYAPVLGRVLDRAIAGGTQRPLVDVVVSRSSAYLRANDLTPQARSFVDDRGWLASLLVSDKRIRGVLDGLADTIEEIERDPLHPVRGWLEGLLRSFADELQHDATTAAKLNVLVGQLIEDPQAQAVLREIVTDALLSVRESLSEGGLQQRVGALVAGVGARLLDDPVFRERVQKVLEALIGHAVENYGDELTSLIRNQVAKWDATSASRRIELAVGRDLQFIRINGTVVGALAGLAIHAVTVAL
ncbi:MAG: rane protein, partial [Frankiales bacterium]|nr:rane protein [Frankiales bacterium]